MTAVSALVAVALLTIVVAIVWCRRRGESNPAHAPAWLLSDVTTACNAWVTRTFNPSGRLQDRTLVVVLYGAPSQETAAVYRRSSTPDKVSVERYPLVNGAWGQRQKDPEKVSAPPHRPADAVETVVDGIQFWTRAPMTEEQTQRMRELIQIRIRRSRA